MLAGWLLHLILLSAQELQVSLYHKDSGGTHVAHCPTAPSGIWLSAPP